MRVPNVENILKGGETSFRQGKSSVTDRFRQRIVADRTKNAMKMQDFRVWIGHTLYGMACYVSIATKPATADQFSRRDTIRFGACLHAPNRDIAAESGARKHAPYN
jgi:hypothetical protein